MKKKKLLTVLASIIMGGALLGGGLSLTACRTGEGDGGAHRHSWSTTEYGHDDTNHWRECTDENCNEVYQVEPHDFKNGDCVCGVKKQTENPSGTGEENPGGTGEENPGGTGEENPGGAGEENPGGTGEENPGGTGEENPGGTGEENPGGTGEENPGGAGEENPGGVGEENPGGTGEENPGGTGEENPDSGETENALTLYTTVLNGQRPQSVQKVFKVGDTFNSANLTVYAKSANGKAQILASDEYSVALKEGQNMTTAGEKTVVVTTTGGVSAEYKIYVLDLSAVDKTGGARVSVNKEATVGVEGNVVTVNTITDAVKVYELLALESNVVKPISVADGEYYENVYINIPNIQLNGSDTKKVADGTVANGEDKNNGVVIWFDALAGGTDPVGTTYGTFGSASVYVGSGASSFVARNITFKSKYNTSALFNQSKEYLQQNFQNSNTQAVALRVDSDRAEFYNCKMTGYHDTLFIYGGNQYYENCWIEGHTDYIFGCDSNAYFHQCKIYSLGDGNAENGGYVVANRPDEGKAEGTHICVFNACDFDGDAQVAAGTVALGRAWGVNMKMAVINSTISGKYSKAAHTAGTGKGQRYCSMGNNPVNEPKPEYMMEYANSGDGAITQTIANTCTYLTEADAAHYAHENAKMKAILGFYPGEVDRTVTYDFSTHALVSGTGTAAAPKQLFGGDMQYTGTAKVYKAGSGDTCLQVNSGVVITLKKKGTVKIKWMQNWGSDEDAAITYKDGYATVKIVRADDNGHILSITVDEGEVPQDTKYTVTFATGEGFPTVDSAVVPANGKVTKPQDPQRDGYTFGGWYKDEGYLTEFDFDTETITADTTLYAKWGNASIVEYDVGLYINGNATKVGTLKIESGDTVSLEKVNTLLATLGYDKIHARGIYTDSAYTTQYTQAISAATDLYVELVYDKSNKIDFTTWANNNVTGNGTVVTPLMKDGIQITGSSYRLTGSTGIQLQDDTVIKIPVAEKATASLNWYDTGHTNKGAQITYENGYAIISLAQDGEASSNNYYLMSINITYPFMITEYTKVTFGSGSNAASTEGVTMNCTDSNGQLKNGNIKICVKKGATIHIAGNWSVDYKIDDTVVQSDQVTGNSEDYAKLNYDYVVPKDGDVVIEMGTSGKNYFYYIEITFPTEQA